KSVTQICRDFQISPSQFYAWKKKLLGDAESDRASGEGMNEVPKEASVAELAEEVRRLRQELAKSQRREEILKKAALILGNDPHNNMS
ncbi:transposase, partial [Persicirhabdus sediminis]